MSNLPSYKTLSVKKEGLVGAKTSPLVSKTRKHLLVLGLDGHWALLGSGGLPVSHFRHSKGVPKDWALLARHW